VTQHEEPVDRLTRMSDALLDVFAQHPEYREGDKCIVFANDRKMGGSGIYGYEDQTEAMADLLLHIRAMFRASGKKMDIVFLGEDGVGRVDG
jgi:Asp/Glu/hydantoin racemase